MIFWFLLAIIVALVAATLRMWSDFARRAQEMRAEIERARGLIESHTEELTTARARIGQLDEALGVLMQERDKLERSVEERRAELTALEERLERTRPKSRRVDKYADGDEIFG